MMIVLLVALGFSFLCTITLVGACALSGRSCNHVEEFSPLREERQSMKPATAYLPTTSTPLA
jgi:hypothetical protein